MILRSQCRCHCHTNLAMDHIAPCCQPDPPVKCCEYDTDGDGNCQIHSMPGVFRNSAFNAPGITRL